jgi:hypothetical protein
VLDRGGGRQKLGSSGVRQCDGRRVFACFENKVCNRMVRRVRGAFCRGGYFGVLSGWLETRERVMTTVVDGRRMGTDAEWKETRTLRGERRTRPCSGWN